MEELISVIVPVYNASKYLCRCIESIQLQTYHNLEIILIDDGSQDDSLKICKQYASKDNRIQVFSQRNAGCSSARNTGLDKCTGSYIAFIDSDDYIHKEYFEYLLYLIKKYKCRISQIQYSYAYDEPEDDIWKNKINDLSKKDIIEKKWKFKDLFSSKNRDYRVISCGKLYDFRLFEKFRFAEGKINEDEEASFVLSYLADTIIISNRHMYYYYMSSNSIMRNNTTSIRWDFLTLHKRIIRFLKKHNEPVILNFERKELCIRLMLCYFTSKKNKLPKTESSKIKKEFDKQYIQIKYSHAFSIIEWVAISLFYVFPSFVTFVQNNTEIVQKVKQRRVQNS